MTKAIFLQLLRLFCAISVSCIATAAVVRANPVSAATPQTSPQATPQPLTSTRCQTVWVDLLETAYRDRSDRPELAPAAAEQCDADREFFSAAETNGPDGTVTLSFKGEWVAARATDALTADRSTLIANADSRRQLGDIVVFQAAIVGEATNMVRQTNIFDLAVDCDAERMSIVHERVYGPNGLSVTSSYFDEWFGVEDGTMSRALADFGCGGNDDLAGSGETIASTPDPEALSGASLAAANE